MNQDKRETKQIELADLAEKILDAEIAKGAAFSEALCDWATHQAEQQIGGLS